MGHPNNFSLAAICNILLGTLMITGAFDNTRTQKKQYSQDGYSSYSLCPKQFIRPQNRHKETQEYFQKKIPLIEWTPNLLSTAEFANPKLEILSEERKIAEKKKSLKMDLAGRRLNVGMLKWPQFVYQDVNTGAYSGFCFDILQLISEKLNFTYSIVEPEDGEWGIKRDGVWHGLVGQLVNGDVDIVMSPLTKNRQREDVIDTICPLVLEKNIVWILNRNQRQERWLVMFELMDPVVCFMLIGCLCVTVAVYLFTVLLLSSDKGAFPTFRDEFGQSCMLFIGVLLRQGSTTLPWSACGRTILGFWWWFGIILSVTYTGTMIATLSDNRHIYPFTSIREMVRQTKWKYGLIGGTSLEDHLKSSTDIKRQLYMSMKEFAKDDPSITSPNVSVHMEKLGTEYYAFIGTLWGSKPTSAKYVHLDIGLETNTACIGLSKNSNLTDYVKQTYDRMLQVGIPQGLWRRYGLVHKLMRYSIDDSTQVMNFHLLKTAFYNIVIGLVVSGVALICEIIAGKYWCVNRLNI